MSIPNNYQDIVNYLNNANNTVLPNYIPVKNMADFNYDVISYYNQYYAPSQVTQNRRILRNYAMYQDSLKKSNKNPFINNNNKKFNFLYTNQQTIMIVESSNICIDMYMLINKCWCKFKHFSDINNCKEYINKNLAISAEAQVK